MKKRLFALGMAVSMLLLASCGGGNSDDSASGNQAAPERSVGAMKLAFDGAAEMSEDDLAKMRVHADVRHFVEGAKDTATVQADSPATGDTHELPLPHTTQAPVSRPERHLLRAYLDRPGDSTLASFLALVHLNRSLLNPAARSRPGSALKNSILAEYFLRRAQDTGANQRWIGLVLHELQRSTGELLRRQSEITSEENHPAHALFNETFNYREGDRYISLASLLDDFATAPKNVYTAFAITASNLWIGGEADHDDPTMLQNFVIGSYFSLHAIDLARRIEERWAAGSTAVPRFRLASILGGFSILQRRWLARVHGDEAAIAALDDEHRKWRLIHRAFHSFTVGVSFFEEPRNFAEGLAAWEDAFAHCAEVPVRTCSNDPRFSHNFASFILGYVDFLLKAGQVEAAKQYLSIRHVPDRFPLMAAYAQWDLGREAWEYRENNAEAIAARYANGHTGDDMTHLTMKKRKWGESTSTCQVCHQAQGATWTDEQKNTIRLPPEQVASVVHWPEVSTRWYGASLSQ